MFRRDLMQSNLRDVTTFLAVVSDKLRRCCVQKYAKIFFLLVPPKPVLNTFQVVYNLCFIFSF